jgi:hypothetical protein
MFGGQMASRIEDYALIGDCAFPAARRNKRPNRIEEN